MIARILVFCALISVSLACIGGGSGGGCCAAPAPSCGGAPPCPAGPSASPFIGSYPQPSSGGYAQAPPAPSGEYAHAPNAYAVGK